MTRACIGHTYITHSFLLKGEPMPQCIPCHWALSVKHILIDCVDFALIRQKYFQVSSMKDLLDKVDPSLIINFIKEIGLFYKF